MKECKPRMFSRFQFAVQFINFNYLNNSQFAYFNNSKFSCLISSDEIHVIHTCASRFSVQRVRVSFLLSYFAFCLFFNTSRNSSELRKIDLQVLVQLKPRCHPNPNSGSPPADPKSPLKVRELPLLFQRVRK